MKFSKSKYRVIFLAGILLHVYSDSIFRNSLTAAEFPRPYDPAGRVSVWSRLTSGESDRFILDIASTFDEKIPWSYRGNSSPLNDLRFIKKFPDNPAYASEVSMLQKQSGSDRLNPHSLMIHTSFDIPGRQNYLIRPKHPVRLAGLPERVSAWVKGDGSNHTVVLLFTNTKQVEIPIFFTKLRDREWKRIEVRLPVAMREIGETLNRSKKRVHFTGIQIKSDHSEMPGDASLIIDNILLLSRPFPSSYPGVEIPDSW